MSLPTWLSAPLRLGAAAALMAVAAWAASAAVAHHYRNALDVQDAAFAAEREQWLNAVDAARAAERRWQAAHNAIAARYQQDIDDEKRLHDRTVAELRAGQRRLRIALAARPGAAADAGAASGTAAASGRHHDAAHGELSPAAAEFLVGLASEADRVVRQLNACQAVVRADRGIRP